MKTLTLARDETGDQGTFSVGTLTSANQRLGVWEWIELPWRENRPELSCIPPGVYHAHLTHSDHFGRDVYVLDDVPGRSAIELHPANYAGDRELGYAADLRGCAAPGMTRGYLIPSRGAQPQRAVMQSQRAFQQFMDACDGDDLEVMIAWAPGAEP